MNNTLIETQNLPQPTDGKITTPQPPSAEDKALATKIGLMGGAASPSAARPSTPATSSPWTAPAATSTPAPCRYSPKARTPG